MKSLKNYLLILLFTVAIVGCQEDDTEFGPVTAPTDVSLTAMVNGQNAGNPDGDGSGLVTFNSTAQGALNYRFDFGDGRTGTSVDGTIEHRFVDQGINTYTVVVIATGTGGAATSESIQVTVFSAFEDDEARQFLTGGSAKSWYWAAAEPGHLGVGPNNGDPEDGNNFFPQFFAAAPFQIDAPCFYEDEMIFSLEDGVINYQLLNNGQTFFNAAFSNGAGEDTCLEFDAGGKKRVTLLPSDSIVPETLSRKTTISFNDGGFMSYFINTSEYEILEITENRLEVRAIQDGNGGLAWYHIFTTDKPI